MSRITVTSSSSGSSSLSNSFSTSSTWLSPSPPRPLAHRTFSNGVLKCSSVSSSAPMSLVSSSSFFSSFSTSSNNGNLNSGSISNASTTYNKNRYNNTALSNNSIINKNIVFSNKGKSANNHNINNETIANDAGITNSTSSSTTTLSPISFSLSPSPIIETEFTVPKDELGRIIGKHGSSINAIKAESGADIKVDSIVSIVNVRGTEKEVNLARRLIQNISGGGGIEIIRDVDETTFRFVQNHPTVKQLSEKLNISIELSKKSLRICAADADEDKASQAKSKILEIIAESRVVKTVEDFLEDKKVRKFFENPQVEILRNTFNSFNITVEKGEEKSKLILKGPKSAIYGAQQIINMLRCSDGRVVIRVEVVPFLFLDIPKKKLDDFHADIHDVIHVPFSANLNLYDEENYITLTVSPADAAEAKLELLRILQYYFVEKCLVLNIPFSSINFVFGSELQHFQQLLSEDLVGHVDEDMGYIWLCGTPDALQNAQDFIEKELDDWYICNDEIILNDRYAVGCVIGSRGETIKKLQEETKATITVHDNIVCIKADNHQGVCDARQAIKSVLKKFEEKNGREKREKPKGSEKERGVSVAYGKDKERKAEEKIDKNQKNRKGKGTMDVAKKEVEKREVSLGTRGLKDKNSFFSTDF